MAIIYVFLVFQKGQGPEILPLSTVTTYPLKFPICTSSPKPYSLLSYSKALSILYLSIQHDRIQTLHPFSKLALSSFSMNGPITHPVAPSGPQGSNFPIGLHHTQSPSPIDVISSSFFQLGHGLCSITQTSATASCLWH